MLKFCSPHGRRREYLVNPGSKAAHRGIREGDFISSINGQNTRDLTNSEAHGLLKSAGDTLKLGLNEESLGSPKRRQYRTVHQETLQETIKKSSITSYSIQKTFETIETQPGKSNENTLSRTNENTEINGTSKNIPPNTIVVSQRSTLSSNNSSASSTPTLTKEGNLTYTSPDNAVASQRSSYTNCTVSPSTTSTLSEDGNSSCTTTQLNEVHNNESSVDNMSDNGNTNSASRSKRRRQRRKNRKTNENQNNEISDCAQNNPSICDNRDNVVVETNLESKDVEELKIQYRVDLPVETTKVKNKLRNNPIKSKSLDDDDMVKIQELSEASESEDKEKETKGIISEASESEVEWEETEEIKPVQSSKGTMNTLTLTLEEYSMQQVTLMSPEEEQTLRDFLEGLNLVNGPEEAARQVHEKTPENVKHKKAQKKAALEEYFLPICQNPRFLDVISEEASDRDSDREQPNLTKNLKQGTPEPSEKPPIIPPRPNRDRRRNLPKKFSSPKEQSPAVLVGTKLVDTLTLNEEFFSTVKTAEAPSSVEIVYLDSSESTSPGDFDNTSTDSFGMESEKNSSNEEINKNEVSSNESIDLENKSENKIPIVMTSEIKQNNNSLINIKKIVANINKSEINTNNCDKTQITNINNVETKPSKIVHENSTLNNHAPMFICKKDNIVTEAKVYEELSGENETLTTSTSTNYSFLVKSNVNGYIEEKNNLKQHYVENGIISQLTPPPTPENISPRNETNDLPSFSETTEKSIDTEVVKTDTEMKNVAEETIKCSNIKIEDTNIQNITNTLSNNQSNLSKILTNENNIESTSSLNEINAYQNYNEVKEYFNQNSIDKSKINEADIQNERPKDLSTYKTYTERAEELSKLKSQTPETETSKIKLNENICNDEVSENKVNICNINVVSPPPPSRSPSQSSSSSRDSSLCTVKYNPLNSSTADVTSITKEEESSKQITYFQPLTLRETCLKFLITLPFGADVLQELADVSLSIESYTSNLPGTLLPKLIPNLPAFVNRVNTDPNNDSSDISVKNMPKTKEWVGIPTETDPKLLVCLSPKQKEELEKTKQVSDEAGKLIDLHEKFLNRKSCLEEVKKETDEKVTITSVSQSSSSVNVTNPNQNRLLSIIKEEPLTTDGNYLYFEEKEPKTNFATLPRTTKTSDARLKAKNLTEWLNLARNRSASESNLNVDIPENNLQKSLNTQPVPKRRSSLPYDLYERQMLYLQEKEREIQRQLEQLEDEKRKLNAEIAPSHQFQAENYIISRKGDFAESKNNYSRPTSMPAMPTEFFRQQMYEEYLDKFAEREERKQQKVIKVTSAKDLNQENTKVASKEVIHPIHLEEEFLEKVKQKQQEGKLNKTEKSACNESSVEKEKDADKEDEPVLLMDGDKLKGAKQLPKHLQEFVSITKQLTSGDGIWAPGQKQDNLNKEIENKEKSNQNYIHNEAIPPVWTPKSANSSPVAERKEFRPVSFQSPVLSRKNRTKSENLGSESPSSAPPWKEPDYNSDTGIAPFLDKRLPTSHSSPASGFGDFSTSSRLPKAQNPTITLLQKAREGQLPRGALYIEKEQRQYRPKNDRPPIAGPGDVLYQIRNEYTSESESEKPRRMADLGPRKFEGIGPVTKDGMPLILRSEIKDQNQSKWYKRMYDTIHKQRPHNDEYVTVRYKQRRAQYPYTSGYLSEPEPGAYDSDFADYKYQTLDRRRPNMQERQSDYINSSTMPRSLTNKSSSDILRNTQDAYKMQPGRIENYTPGHSSISEKEAKEWWDEVMDIFDGHLEQQKRVPQQQPRSFINQALKESGYESDSTLVFRRREEAAQQLSPKEQKEAYKVIQKGGDVPLHGLRKPAPERPKDPEPPAPPPKGLHARNLEPESPRKYVENEVTIHYKTPVRQEIKEYLSEDELAHRQAEAMKKIYQEERRKKYLQELQDMNSRRHTDNFIPSQKSPISLNRYDDFDDLAPNVKPRPRSPEPRLVARALYNFVGQTARELTFRKGDLIYVRRQVDKNWYEGELNAMVGLFPTNYVEIVPYDGIKSTPRKSHEGQARAKYNFVAQTHLELSLAKGELVVITRRVDDNWFEGKIGGRKGIFPASYVEVLIDAQEPPSPSTKPVASPASHSLLLNGSAGGKESMGSHYYTPSLPNPLTTSYHAKPVQISSSGSYGSLGRPLKNPVSQALHIETQSEPIPYRALYKYNPQNDDELELLEGDTVYVLEKCDDGWYVGSSNRTGAFGTFPGNYVEKI